MAAQGGTLPPDDTLPASEGDDETSSLEAKSDELRIGSSKITLENRGEEPEPTEPFQVETTDPKHPHPPSPPINLSYQQNFYIFSQSDADFLERLFAKSPKNAQKYFDFMLSHFDAEGQHRRKEEALESEEWRKENSRRDAHTNKNRIAAFLTFVVVCICGGYAIYEGVPWVAVIIFSLTIVAIPCIFISERIAGILANRFNFSNVLSLSKQPSSSTDDGTPDSGAE